jgi:hypothetical protein
VEAALLGMLRSNRLDLADPVLKLWATSGFQKMPSREASANLAALILGREGRTEALAYLQKMTLNAENMGYRALAGWYATKMSHQTAELMLQAMK